MISRILYFKDFESDIPILSVTFAFFEKGLRTRLLHFVLVFIRLYLRYRILHLRFNTRIYRFRLWVFYYRPGEKVQKNLQRYKLDLIAGW